MTLVLPIRRDRRPEIMDQPGLREDSHRRALAGLRRLNLWAGSARTLHGPIAALAHHARRTSPARRTRTARPAHREDGEDREPRPLTLLDVACGAGDVPIALARWSRRGGPPLTILGCDRSTTAAGHAREAARRAGQPVTFLCADALGGAALPARADIVTCSLFLHHLDEADAAALLARCAAAARHGVLVLDLRRGALGLGLAWAAARALSRSSIVHHDAPASVRAAYTLDEARALAERAGLSGARVQPAWPQRWLLSWWRP